MARSKRELPFKVLPTNPAGDSLLDLQHDTLLDGFLRWSMVAMALAAMAVMDWTRYLLKTPPNPIPTTIFAAIAVILAFILGRRALRKSYDMRAGIWGERYVGAVLDELRVDGFQIVHDVPDKKGNIDHVVIGPGGVFTIETKTRTKRAGARDKKIFYDGECILADGLKPDRDPIAQAHAQARQIREILKDQTTEDVSVQPVVTYPGWYVEVKAKAPSVWVHNENYLVMRLRDLPRVLSSKQVDTYANALRRYVRGTFGEIELE